MKPNKVRLLIFVALWLTYLGASTIVFVGGKAHDEMIMGELRGLKEAVDFNEKQARILEQDLLSANSLEKSINLDRINRRAALISVSSYVLTGLWFYICACILSWFICRAQARE